MSHDSWTSRARNLDYRHTNNMSRAACYNNVERGFDKSQQIDKKSLTPLHWRPQTMTREGGHPSNDGTITENGLFCIFKHPLNDMFRDPLVAKAWGCMTHISNFYMKFVHANAFLKKKKKKRLLNHFNSKIHSHSAFPNRGLLPRLYLHYITFSQLDLHQLKTRCTTTHKHTEIWTS